MSAYESSAGPRILIRADASPQIGGGHIMRCLSLAGELACHGAETTFVCAMIPPALAARVAAAGHRLVHIEPAPELLSRIENWDSATLPREAQLRDAAAAHDAAGPADWIMVDHYRLDTIWLDAAPAGAQRAVIDDLANRPQLCEMLIDQTFGRVASDYAPWVPDGCRVLAGAHFALLRPEFAAARPAALLRRRQVGQVGRLLLTLGSTDIGSISLHVLESLLAKGVN